MLDGYRALLDHADQLEREDPSSKGTFFSTSAESARRPEVARHHDRQDRLPVPDARVLPAAPAPPSAAYDDVWRVVPPFGPVPSALSRTYPLTAEVPERSDRAAIEAAADGVARLVDAHPETTFGFAHRGWPSAVLESLPDELALFDGES